MKKITVIVPIYNAEEYLKRCIDSILSQTYEKLEIILVNDGSTDNSGEICDEYQLQDERIKVIHKSNGGQSSARNRGIDIATGEYVAFVDSDDWIVDDIYEHSIKLIEKYNGDIVDFKVEFTNGKIKEEVDKKCSINIFEEKEILRNYLYKGQVENAPFSPCRKLYKKALFDNIRFPEGKINEDIATNYKILTKCKKLISTDKVGYYYFQSDNSTTRNGLSSRDFDLLDACEELKLLTQDEEYKDIKYLSEIKYARSYFSLLAKIAFYGVEDKDLDKEQVIKKLTKELRRRYLLLIKSPIPFNRKMMVTALAVNFRCLSFPLDMYKKIRKK